MPSGISFFIACYCAGTLICLVYSYFWVGKWVKDRFWLFRKRGIVVERDNYYDALIKMELELVFCVVTFWATVNLILLSVVHFFLRAVVDV